jgi:hypothetical protein
VRVICWTPLPSSSRDTAVIVYSAGFIELDRDDRIGVAWRPCCSRVSPRTISRHPTSAITAQAWPVCLRYRCSAAAVVLPGSVYTAVRMTLFGLGAEADTTRDHSNEGKPVTEADRMERGDTVFGTAPSSRRARLGPESRVPTPSPLGT